MAVNWILNVGAWVALAWAVTLLRRKFGPSANSLVWFYGAVVLLKLAEFWAVFFLYMRTHAPQTAYDLGVTRMDHGIVILSAPVFAWSIYLMGQKPQTPFWRWLWYGPSEEISGGTVSA